MYCWKYPSHCCSAELNKQGTVSMRTNVAALFMLQQNIWKIKMSNFYMALTAPHILHNCTTNSLSTVSTISSNYHPPLIDVNNNRRKLVNGEHNCPRQKAKHSKSHFTAGASRRRRLGCSQWAGRGISPQISIYHLNHISLLGHPLNRMTDSKKLSYSLMLHMVLFGDLRYESTWICAY